MSAIVLIVHTSLYTIFVISRGNEFRKLILIARLLVMADKKIPQNGTGETVRVNFKRLRGGMQYKELAQKLEAIGRPIPTLGLRRIEAGERRVDVDDLMALAVVFDVSPLTLLLPADGSRVLASPMTGVLDREVAHNTQWLYGLGLEPLVIDEMDLWDVRNSATSREFQLRSVPTVDEREVSDLGDGAPSGPIPEEKVRGGKNGGNPIEEGSMYEKVRKSAERVSYLAYIQGVNFSAGDDGND